MSKRAISGKTITRDAQEAALQPEKPLLFGYRPSTATKYAENARKSEENGPYGQLSAISMTFLRSMNLTGRKTAKNSNKGLQPTTHNWSAMHTASLATHLSGTVRGSRLTPDVELKTITRLREIAKAAATTIKIHLAGVFKPPVKAKT